MSGIVQGTISTGLIKFSRRSWKGQYALDFFMIGMRVQEILAMDYCYGRGSIGIYSQEQRMVTRT